jgi:rRNA-processing protein FCF1
MRQAPELVLLYKKHTQIMLAKLELLYFNRVWRQYFMHKLKVYLDTSIVNFLYVEDSPEYRKATEVFFENVVTKNKVETYISNIVIDEINKTEDETKRNILSGTFEKYEKIKTLIAESEIINDIAILSESYIKNGIIPKKKTADSLHVAYATVFQMDILLSWNFQHLANVNKEQKIILLNKTLGYNYSFRMANPLEVYFEE